MDDPGPLARDGDLAIRPLRDRDDDLALLVRWRGMPHVHEWWDPEEPPPSLEQMRAKYGPRTREGHATTSCVIEQVGRPVGYLQFYRWSSYVHGDPDDVDIPLDDDPWGLDIYIGEPDLIGSGTGTRAVALLCRYLHERRGARSVILLTALTNTRAQRAYEKAGFRKVREVLDSDVVNGERVRSWLMRWDPTP